MVRTITIIIWQSGRAVAWDVTVAITLADSYLPASSVNAVSGGATDCLSISEVVSHSAAIKMHLPCTTAFHHVWISGHQWNSV